MCLSSPCYFCIKSIVRVYLISQATSAASFLLSSPIRPELDCRNIGIEYIDKVTLGEDLVITNQVLGAASAVSCLFILFSLNYWFSCCQLVTRPPWRRRCSGVSPMVYPKANWCQLVSFSVGPHALTNGNLLLPSKCHSISCLTHSM